MRACRATATSSPGPTASAGSCSNGSRPASSWARRRPSCCSARSGPRGRHRRRSRSSPSGRRTRPRCSSSSIRARCGSPAMPPPTRRSTTGRCSSSPTATTRCGALRPARGPRRGRRTGVCVGRRRGLLPAGAAPARARARARRSARRHRRPPARAGARRRRAGAARPPGACARSARRRAPGQSRRLAETLRAWLVHQGRRDAVAAELQVHPQTVRYRMTRIRELFGARLDDPRARLELIVGLATA